MICKDLYHLHTYVCVCFVKMHREVIDVENKKKGDLKLIPVKLHNQWVQNQNHNLKGRNPNHNLKGRHIVNVHGDKIQAKIK